MKRGLLFGALLLTGSSFAQTIASEDFESGMPGTWSQTTNASDGGWLGGTAASLSSSYFTISGTNATNMLGTNDDDCNCDKSADRLITESYDLQSQSAVFLSVDVFFGKGTYNGSTEIGTIEVSVGGGAWTQVADLAGGADWRNELVDVSAYVGNSDVRFSFLYNDDAGWMFGWALDNFELYAPQPDDAVLASVSIPRYALVGSNTNLDLEVQNLGSNTITSLTIDWNDGTSHSQTVSANIAPGASATVTHPTAVTYATATEATLNVSITQVNGNTDPNPGNNDGTALHNTVSELIAHNVLIEEGTGTWCGWCPRGAVAMEYMYDTYPSQFVGIAVHNGDPMTVTEYDNGADLSGFPGCNVDRVLLDQSVSSSLFESYYNDRKDIVVPVDLALAYSGTGSSVTVDVDATFKTVISSANFRLAVVMIEDGVTGTASGYNQTNYYSSQSQNIALNGAGHDWQQEPNPVPAADMVYDHVGRALLGGFDGQAGSVPGTIADGTVASYTFNYTVPSTSDRANMYAVGMLIDNTTGEVIQSQKIPVSDAGIEAVDVVNMKVYPNPASEFVTVDFEAQNADYAVTITDLAGRVVKTVALGTLAGAQSFDVPVQELISGNYLISVSTQGASYTQMISVK